MRMVHVYGTIARVTHPGSRSTSIASYMGDQRSASRAEQSTPALGGLVNCRVVGRSSHDGCDGEQTVPSKTNRRKHALKGGNSTWIPMTWRVTLAGMTVGRGTQRCFRAWRRAGRSRRPSSLQVVQVVAVRDGGRGHAVENDMLILIES